MWLLVVAVAVLVATSLPAGPPPSLPPPEALEESPGYGAWKVTGVVLSPDGEVATIRLQHPREEKVVAVLHYRLIYSGVFEVPNGASGVAPEGP